MATSGVAKRRRGRRRSLLTPKTNIALRQSVALKARLCARTCRAKRTPDGNRLRIVATRLNCCSQPTRAGCLNFFPFATDGWSPRLSLFIRGSAAQMAADLARTPNSGLRVQACGDAHLMNFGGFATPERNIIFDINDFDETLPGPWEWDLKRLAASAVVAGRHLRLSDNDSARVAISTARSYREQMTDYAEMRALEVWYDRIDVKRDGASWTKCQAKRRASAPQNGSKRCAVKPLPSTITRRWWSIMAPPRIKDNPPLIYHPTAKQAPGLKTGFREGIAAYRNSLPEHVRVLLDRFHFCDLAIKAVGVGSVGTFCGVGLFLAADDDPIFLQIKEARHRCWNGTWEKPACRITASESMAGQRLMQSASDIFLGWAPGLKQRRDFYVRQLHDMKISRYHGRLGLRYVADLPKLRAWLSRGRMRALAMPP